MDGRDAIRQAYQVYYRRLVAILYPLTGSFADAQDLAQETFARALLRPQRFLAVAEPEAWLRTVAVNLARTRWRRRWRLDALVRAGRVERPPDTAPPISPDRVALVTALQRLPRPTREALVLHHIVDLTVEQVAETLGVPAGTVKSRLSRGRAALADLLADPDPDKELRHA